MPSERNRRAAERFQTALALYELAEEMLRQKVRREHPEASEEEIEQHVVEWRLHRPGAEFGDGPGLPVPWPRRHE